MERFWPRNRTQMEDARGSGRRIPFRRWLMLTRLIVPTLLAAAVLLPAAGAHAQEGFLFRPPMGQLTLRAGPLLPRAQSDVFDFITSELTVDRGDFLAPSLSAELGVLAGSRLDIVLGLGWSESSTRSEFRALIGDDGLPIEQTTTLRLMPVTLSGRFLPIERGRRLGTLAWLPATVTPYVGGGGGVTFYRLRQQGEFVNAATNDIFVDEYTSSGRGMTVHGLAGVDYWFSPRIGANLEGRYTRGSADMVGSFRTYDSLDLTGFGLGVGVTFRW